MHPVSRKTFTFFAFAFIVIRCAVHLTSVQAISKMQPHDSASMPVDTVAIIKYPNGDIYIGQVNNDGQRHGHGVLKYNAATSDESTSILVYPNGDTYIGQVDNYGRRDGQGILKYKDGRIYDGEWSNGNMHEESIMKYDGAEM